MVNIFNYIQKFQLGKTIKKRIHKNVPPDGYSTNWNMIGQAIDHYYRDEGMKNPEKGILDREIFGYSLGVTPQDSLKTWEQTPYKPTIAKDTSVNYIRPRREQYDELELTKLINESATMPADTVMEANQNLFKGNPNAHDPLARFSKSRGKDDSGNYIAINDTWDLKNPLANMFLENKPEIYDRFYYEENPNYTPEAEEYHNLLNKQDSLVDNIDYINKKELDKITERIDQLSYKHDKLINNKKYKLKKAAQ